MTIEELESLVQTLEEKIKRRQEESLEQVLKAKHYVEGRWKRKELFYRS